MFFFFRSLEIHLDWFLSLSLLRTMHLFHIDYVFGSFTKSQYYLVPKNLTFHIVAYYFYAGVNDFIVLFDSTINLYNWTFFDFEPDGLTNYWFDSHFFFSFVYTLIFSVAPIFYWPDKHIFNWSLVYIHSTWLVTAITANSFRCYDNRLQFTLLIHILRCCFFFVSLSQLERKRVHFIYQFRHSINIKFYCCRL